MPLELVPDFKLQTSWWLNNFLLYLINLEKNCLNSNKKSCQNKTLRAFAVIGTLFVCVGVVFMHSVFNLRQFSPPASVLVLFSIFWSTDLARWRRCQSLLRLKLQEQKLFEETGDEHLSSDEASRSFLSTKDYLYSLGKFSEPSWIFLPIYIVIGEFFFK